MVGHYCCDLFILSCDIFLLIHTLNILSNVEHVVGVWTSLANDYIGKPLQNGTRNHFDLVSIVVMQDDGAEVVLRHQPTTWVLYNKLVEMREWTSYKPSGHGYYLPAIDQAETLLTSNTNAGCSLSLLFFSDGKPSDPQVDRPLILQRLGKLASRFGRRLSLACIGMAEESEDFSCLNDMVDEARQYGAMASFGKPSLDANSLSNIVTSLASSLTTSRTEMTKLKTGRVKMVRMDIERGKNNAPDCEGTWEIFSSNDKTVNRFWTWNHSHTNGFVGIVDRRCMYCYSEDVSYRCPGCNACFLCRRCFGQDPFTSHRTRYNHRQSECTEQLTKVRVGSLVHKDKENIPTFSIAVKNQTFGEGAERVVRKGKLRAWSMWSTPPLLLTFTL